MLSVEIIEHLRREEERRRREQEAPVLRIPVEKPLEHYPEEEKAAEDAPAGNVIILDMSQDDVDEFKIATW